MNGEFRALSLGSLAVILVALGIWAAAWGPDDEVALETDPTAEAEPAPASSAPTTTTETMAPQPDAGEGNVDGPVVRHSLPFALDGDSAEVGGTLMLRDGCLVFAYPGDGPDSQLPIVWPATTRWDDERSEVVLPTGDRVGIGDSVVGGGGYHSAGWLDSLDDDATELLTACALNTWREVAMFNNGSSAAKAG